MKHQVIYLQTAAPDKPDPGATCNGCGVCCATETCPLGMLIFWQRRGPCPALYWSPAASRYFCGFLLAPQNYVRCLPKRCIPLATRLFQRWIAAGMGCDSTVVATPHKR